MRKTLQNMGEGHQKKGASYNENPGGNVGKLHRGQMHLTSAGGKDALANSHGHGDGHAKGGHLHGAGPLAHGFNPPEEYQGSAAQKGGAPSMASNEKCC